MSEITDLLYQMGQSLWLDNLTRGLPDSGTVQKYISELSVTGLTFNPTICDHAIKNSNFYDTVIAQKVKEGKSGEALFFELAIADLTRAADRFKPIHERTNGVDGWVSKEVSPKLAYDTKTTLAAAKQLHAQAGRPNLFIKIPGTCQGLPTIEEALFAGVPVNVTLLFSREHYQAAAAAYLRGIERRIEAGLNPCVESVASVFVGRWDGAVMGKVPAELNDRLGIAMAERTYKAYRDRLNSDRWMKFANYGAQPQRLLWASTGSKDPQASDYLYVKALALPNTVNILPEATLLKFGEHATLGRILSAGGGDSDEVVFKLSRLSIDMDALAAQMQKEGADSFVKSWDEMMAVMASKAQGLKQKRSAS